MTDADKTVAPDENKLIAERRAKLAHLRERGNAFPNDFRRTAKAGELQNSYVDETKEVLEERNEIFAVAGRLIRNRGAFLLIQDDTSEIQLYINRKVLDADTLEMIKSWDLGILLRLAARCIEVAKAIYISTWKRRSC